MLQAPTLLYWHPPLSCCVKLGLKGPNIEVETMGDVAGRKSMASSQCCSRISYYNSLERWGQIRSGSRNLSLKRRLIEPTLSKQGARTT